MMIFLSSSIVSGSAAGEVTVLHTVSSFRAMTNRAREKETVRERDDHLTEQGSSCLTHTQRTSFQCLRHISSGSSPGELNTHHFRQNIWNDYYMSFELFTRSGRLTKRKGNTLSWVNV